MSTFNFDELLRKTVELEGSDLHLAVGMPPMVRVYGSLMPLDLPVLRPSDVKEMLMPVLDDLQKEQLLKEWELDFSYAIEGLSRFRGSAMVQRGSYDVVLRAVPWKIPQVEELGLPPVVKELSRLPRGLVVVTGPTGSGKSTTLASMVGMINEERSCNIVTVENPIEFLHSHKKAIVRQREVGNDTKSFSVALRHMLRHDPDVILIGEMRDMESIAIALTAAETGHLVFSTLHTQTAPLALHRIVDVFPESVRNYVRLQLADSLKGVISQQLLPRADKAGRVAAVEVLVNTPAVANMVREGNEHQLYTAMQTGRDHGMQTMDSALADLCIRGVVTREEAVSRAVNKAELERALL
ncbi:type IV pilus twitching motility protein PilT [Dethiobacter alkaliphilus]|uniref:type IV pilus twitching motility protein PilT n=1 Tax=Dethiobacter alkaliphilus TaxID=427926 RepID=UPI00222695ED|nr:type IV pilus twitching motility protein PilT [Dethiobacter alkaliphilus]MCW3490292.1 type IV pilus twitching motility protein PilT [Dethiobacter alkaliphilus]